MKKGKEMKQVYQAPSIEDQKIFLELGFMTGSVREDKTGITEGDWENGGNDSEYEEIL